MNEMDSGPQGTTHQGIRASDAERERAAEALKQHFLDGRLTTEEYSERLDTVYAARTREQLDTLLSDLPPLAAPETHPQPTRPWWRRLHPVAAVFALISALWLAGWLVGGGHPHGFFPIWPLLIWGFFLVRRGAWRLPRR